MKSRAPATAVGLSNTNDPRSSDLAGATPPVLEWYAYLIVAALLYVVIVAFSIDKPLTLDQTDNAQNAAAIADLGFSALGEYGYKVYHPQLHEHILALAYRGLGKSSTVSRILNILCSFVVMFLIIQLSRAIFNDERGTTIGGIAVLLYATNPFILQHSLIVDRDTTIHPISILLYFWVFIRQEDRFTRLAIVKLGALLALAAWAKEFSPAFILTPTFLYLWWRLNFREALSITVGIAIVGGTLFVTTWLAYCWWTGVPPLSFVELSIVNRVREGYFAKRSPLAGVRSLFGRYVPWLTPGFFILAALAAGHRLSQLHRERYTPKAIDALWLFVIIFWSTTNFYMSGISRWQFPLYGVAVILVAQYVYLMTRNLGLGKIFGAIGVGMAVGVLTAVALDDPLLRDPDRSFAEMAVWYLSLWFAAPLVACFALTTMLKVPMLSPARMALTMLSFLAAISLALNIKQTAEYTTAPSWGGEYGEEGFNETLAYLGEHVDDSVPVIRKDLAYYLMMMDEYGRDLEWIYNAMFRVDLRDPDELREVKDRLLRPEVRYVVLDIYSTTDWSRPWEAATYFADDFEHVATFGDFRIYEKKGSR